MKLGHEWKVWLTGWVFKCLAAKLHPGFDLSQQHPLPYSSS
jgi:hypothetical protein